MGHIHIGLKNSLLHLLFHDKLNIKIATIKSMKVIRQKMSLGGPAPMKRNACDSSGRTAPQYTQCPIQLRKAGGRAVIDVK